MFLETMLILLVPLAIWGLLVGHSKKTAIKKAILDMEKFCPDKVWYASDWSSAMAIDNIRQQIALVQRAQNQLKIRVIEGAHIVSAEIVEDGASLLKTARAGQLGGAAIGGLVFGPLGAVVGGLSGAKRQIEKVRRIDLNIIVQDLPAPRFSACFLGAEVDKSGSTYQARINEAREWAAHIDALIHATAGKPSR